MHDRGVTIGHARLRSMGYQFPVPTVFPQLDFPRMLKTQTTDVLSARWRPASMTRVKLSSAVLVLCGLLCLVSGHCPDEFASKDCKKLKDNKVAGGILKDICEEVPFAAGCSIHSACERQSLECDVFALTVHLCAEFPELSACKTYEKACGAAANVPNCVEKEAFKTDSAYEDVRSICDDHFMEDCSSCKTLSDMPSKLGKKEMRNKCPSPLGTLSDLCGMMDMIPCEPFKEWCADEGSPICPEPFISPDMKPKKADHHKDSYDKSSKDKTEDTMEGGMTGGSGGMTGGSGSMTGGSGHAHGQHESNDRTADDPQVSVQAQTVSGCYENPQDEGCIDFKHPDGAIMKNIMDLCVTKGMSMPWMVGCTLWESCKDSNSDDGYCNDFSILATLCADMPMMGGCKQYNALCAAGSKVEQCKEHPQIPNAPTTDKSQVDMITACEDHSMPGCVQCPRRGAACSQTLTTMSTLCHTMPDMAFCSTFTTFCDSVKGSFDDICVPEDGSFLPPMRMYFHVSLRDVVLFKEWVPSSTAEYVFSFLAVVLMGIIVQALKTARMCIERKWFHAILNYGGTDCSTCLDTTGKCDPKCEMACGPNCGEELKEKPKRVFVAFGQAKRNVLRSLFTVFVTTLEYALMLVAMTFNVGLFIAVILGFALGSLFFGHFNEPTPIRPSLASRMNMEQEELEDRVAQAAGTNDCCGGMV